MVFLRVCMPVVQGLIYFIQFEGPIGYFQGKALRVLNLGDKYFGDRRSLPGSGGAIGFERHFTAATQVDAAQNKRAPGFIFETSILDFDHNIIPLWLWRPNHSCIEKRRLRHYNKIPLPIQIHHCLF
jgi:hypothetical protein